MSDQSPDRSTPIVLVHGFFGFDRLAVAGMTVGDYFRRIPDALREAGYVVPTPPRLSPSGGIAARAADLKNYLEDRSNAEVFGKRVHLVAHSMGGLDARYLISKLGFADRVVSLTTIGTPHLGSPIADLVVAGIHPLISRLAEFLGRDVQGFSDLTTAACERFNREVADVPSVGYFATAGRFEPSKFIGLPLGALGLTHQIIRDREGDNDGLVSIRSATFDGRRPGWKFFDAWEANHFRLINWGNNLVPTPAELNDPTILERYKRLIAAVTAAR